MFPLLLLLAGAPSALADGSASCDTPRDAALSLLAALQPDHHAPEEAARCLALAPDQAGEGEALAVDLKHVLDARGWYIQVDELPVDADHTDALGRHRVALVPGEPRIYLEKLGGRWLWSRETLAAVPGLASETFRGLGRQLVSAAPALAREVLGVPLWKPALFLILLSVGALLGRALTRLAEGRVSTWLARSGGTLDRAVLLRTRRPMAWLVMALVVLMGVPELQLSVNPSRALLFACRMVMGLATVLILLRWADVFIGVVRERASKTSSRMDDQVVPLAGQALKVAVVVVGLIFVLQNMGVDVASLVAGLGIGGLALALAAQETLANVFGSLMIFLDRPFQVGDWVIVEGGVEGTVEQVGFRSTRIRAFNNSVITLPNARVASARVDNMGERQYRRFKTTLGLTYDTPPDLVQAYVEGLRAILKAHPKVRQDYYEVHLRDLGASSLEIMVYCFFVVPDWHAELETRSQLLLEFMRLARELGVSFAFPSQSLYLESTPERPLPRRGEPSVDAMAAVVHSFGPEGERSRPLGPRITEGYNASADAQRGDA